MRRFDEPSSKSAGPKDHMIHDQSTSRQNLCIRGSNQRPSVDYEYIQREAVGGVEGMRLCNVEVQVALQMQQTGTF
jgi:hypothetical protein